MTMMAGYFTKQMPFHTVYIHGLVRDEKNQKMSKSKNNGIDPLLLINKYGTDALRYALVKEVTGAGQDIRLEYNRKTDESITVEIARNFANKLWNASRFVMMNLGDEREDLNALPQGEGLTLADHWLLSRYSQTVLQTRETLDSYGLGESAKILYDFIWGDFCDWYIELVKSRLQESADPVSRRAVRQVLGYVLNQTLRLLHPFMPHVTEEIWQILTYGVSEPDPSRPVLPIQAYPEVQTDLINPELEEQFTLLIGVIRTLRNLRAEAEIKPGLVIKAIVQSESARERELLTAGQQYLLDLARLSEVAIVADGANLPQQSISGVIGTVQVVVPLEGVVDVSQFTGKLQKNLAKLQKMIESTQGRLNNAGYVEKAPPEVVAAARAELAESLKQQEILQGRLNQLSGGISDSM